MTFTYKTVRVNGYSIELYQNKYDSVYRVGVYPVIDDDNSIFGYPVSDRAYTTEKQALRRFNNAIRYYREV